jgi:hypothetical protein
MTHISSKSCEALLAPFRIDTIQEIDAPAGCDGIWQRYVISQGSNTIVGMRSGAQSDVNRALCDIVERLNVRFAKQRAKESGEKPPKKLPPPAPAPEATHSA